MAQYFDASRVENHANLCTVCGNRVSSEKAIATDSCRQPCCSDRCLRLHQSYCGFEKQQLLCGTEQSTRDICMCLDISNVSIKSSEINDVVFSVAQYGARTIFDLVLKDGEKLNSKAIALMPSTTGCGTSLVYFLQFVWMAAHHSESVAVRNLECATIRLAFGLRLTEASVSVPELHDRPAVECISLVQGNSIATSLKSIDQSFACTWKRDRANNICDAVYFFRFYNRHRIEEGAAMKITDLSSEEALWRATADKPHTLAHSFFVRLIGDSFAVVQSYYGYYDVDAWLDWENDLQISKKFAPASGIKSVQPAWHHPLEKRPRFRGLLSVKHDGDAFATAIDRIAQNHGMNDYRDVTGVCVNMKQPPLYLAFVRLNLC